MSTVTRQYKKYVYLAKIYFIFNIDFLSFISSKSDECPELEISCKHLCLRQMTPWLFPLLTSNVVAQTFHEVYAKSSELLLMSTRAVITTGLLKEKKNQWNVLRDFR